MTGDGADIPEQDRVTLFAMPPPLRDLAAGAVTAVEDQPTACTHYPSPLICSAHTDAGAMCEQCAQTHFAGHTILTDSVCSSCGTLDVSVAFGWLPGPGDEYVVLVRLCGRCRGGDTVTYEPAGHIADT